MDNEPSGSHPWCDVAEASAPAADTTKTAYSMEAACKLAEIQEMNLSASITRD